MKQAPDTETLSRLFLELSQFLPETYTRRELELKRELDGLKKKYENATAQAFSDIRSLAFKYTQEKGCDESWHLVLQIADCATQGRGGECPACKGDGDETCGMSCKTCGGTGKV